MTKDRLNDLKTNTAWPNISYRRLSREFTHHEDPSAIYHARRHSTIISLDNQSPITEFLVEISEIQITINKIDELAQQIKHLYIELRRTTNNPEIGQELDAKTVEIKRLSRETSAKLRKMEQTQDDLNQSIAHRRIRESQVFVLTRRLREIMIQYNQDTVAHRQQCKNDLIYELELIGNRRTDDELEELLENSSNGLFNFAILVDTQKAEQTFNELEARHRDLLKLEKSLVELHEMMRDLADLVSRQGEMIDCIEHNVSRAAEYVEDAAENVSLAEKYRKEAIRKKILILIILIFSFLLIIFFLFLGYFTYSKILGR